MTATLISVQTGKVAPLGPDAMPSGFVKRPRDGAVTVRDTGLDGDEQADLSVHGGPDKAVYGYAGAHYLRWAADHPRHAALFAPGVMGENLTVAGMEETDICVGDIHRIGTALLQACQPRQPCIKLALRFDDPLMVKAMVKTGRAGWYYRVVQPGLVQAGDAVTLEDRPNPDFSFARLVAIINHRNPERAELEAMTGMAGLALQWREQAQEALRGL
jgi:MOSC domain-containing protein YiiM